MKLIQLILVPSLFLLTFVYFSRLRTRFFDRLLVLVIGLAGVVMVMVPSMAQRLAGLLGVGRGVDVIIYIAITGLGFVVMLLFAKIRELEALLTEAVRAQALKNASEPAENP